MAWFKSTCQLSDSLHCAISKGKRNCWEKKKKKPKRKNKWFFHAIQPAYKFSLFISGDIQTEDKKTHFRARKTRIEFSGQLRLGDGFASCNCIKLTTRKTIKYNLKMSMEFIPTMWSWASIKEKWSLCQHWKIPTVYLFVRKQVRE